MVWSQVLKLKLGDIVDVYPPRPDFKEHVPFVTQVISDGAFEVTYQDRYIKSKYHSVWYVIVANMPNPVDVDYIFKHKKVSVFA